jgi:hypothetical protein
MSESPRLTELQQRLTHAGTVTEVRQVLADLDRLAVETPTNGIRDVIDQALRSLQTLTAADPLQAVPVLVDDLLPRCLQPDQPGDEERWPRFDVLLREWLQTLPDGPRVEVRRTAVPRALKASHGDGVRNALRVLSSIGYGAPKVLRRLDDLWARRSDETGDYALAVRAWLCPHPLGRLRRNLHQRIPRALNRPLLATAKALGNRETVELIWGHWLSQNRSGADSQIRLELALTLLVDIAARYTDSSLPNLVWRYLLELSQLQPGRIASLLALGSNVATRLPAEDVVPELLRRAGRESSHGRYLHYLRLTECALPTHLRSWNTVSLENLVPVREEAVRSTKVRGPVMTVEVNLKQKAWDVLLCSADTQAVGLLAQAVEVEESPYSRHLFLELAGCLAPAPLSPTIATLVEGHAPPDWPKEGLLLAQIGAIRAAHGAADQSSFETLLEYQPLGGDGVLLSAVEALADATITTPHGRRRRTRRLLGAAENAPSPHTRATAAAAVASLVEREQLHSDELLRAARLAAEQSVDEQARRALLFAFAVQRFPLPDEIVDYAQRVLDDATGAESNVLYAPALALVARVRGHETDDRFLATRLGLLVGESGVDIELPVVSESVPHIVARYFVASPARFAPAISTLVRTGAVDVLSAVLPSINNVRPVPLEVLDTLALRVRRADEGLFEPPVLHTLARIAPKYLLSPVRSNVENWLPQARAELADILGSTGALEQEQSQSRFDLLVRLAGDGVYAVRRAAYRAAARCDPDKFLALVTSWGMATEGEGEGPRRNAAEAAGWLPHAPLRTGLAALAWDREPGVRLTFRRMLAERDERLRAARYATHVCSVRHPRDVIRKWRYGVALAQIGDDATLNRLDERLATRIHPAVRLWLERIRKAVQQRWDETTRKWPEPWFTRRGHLEQFMGTFRSLEGGPLQVGESPSSLGALVWAGGPPVPVPPSFSVSGVLWQLPSETLGGWESWGGWATGLKGNPGEWDLHVPDRNLARVLITSVQFPQGTFVFVGNGPYPKPV